MATPVLVLNSVRLADPLSDSPAEILYPPVSALSNGSGVFTITAGGTHQALAPANTVRRYLMVQNHSSADLWINEGTTATLAPPSIRVAPGAVWEYAAQATPTGAMRIIGATTGQSFTVKEV